MPGLAAVVFGGLGLKQSREPNSTGRGLSIAGLVLGVLNLLGWTAYFILIFVVLVPQIGKARGTVNQVLCLANMHQIAQALNAYANANSQQFPPDLGTLLMAQSMNANEFICPSSTDTPANGTTPQQQARSLGSGGHLSFVYLGKGLTLNNSTLDRIVLYEPLSHHPDGANFAYADGHVVHLDPQQAAKAIAELQSGHNPPRGLTPRTRRSTTRSKALEGSPDFP